jgi:nucleoside-diphosphate-sugar epimerase
MQKILITGAKGQIGSELYPLLQKTIDPSNIFTLDLAEDHSHNYFQASVTEPEKLEEVVSQNQITHIYHLAAILSANGERNPKLAWEVNMQGLLNVLECAKKFHCQVFWPSSIAAFGPNTPKAAPQHTVMEPTTMYGITKKTGEDLCHYYYRTYGVDVRSVRFPGILSYKTPPGGGTSDFAVAVFYEGLQHHKYESFVQGRTQIPLMYIDDALQAMISIMSAPVDAIKIRTSYNISGLSCTFDDLIAEINKHLELHVTFNPDFRQQIADSWPDALIDEEAQNDWGWQPKFDLSATTSAMLSGLKEII